MSWKQSQTLALFATAVITIGWFAPMTLAQQTPTPSPTTIPTAASTTPEWFKFPVTSITTLGNSNNLPEQTRTQWMTVDGRRIFQIAAFTDNLAERAQQVQGNLNQIAQTYYHNDRDDLAVELRLINGIPTIYVNNQYLLTVTDLDARLRRLDTATWAEQLRDTLRTALSRARNERQKPFLTRASKIIVGILTATALFTGVLSYQRHRLQKQLLLDFDRSENYALQRSIQRNQRIQTQQQILKITQISTWLVALYAIFEQLPHTRPISQWLLYQTPIPLHLIVTVLVTYFAIRISYNLIDRIQSANRLRQLLTPIDPQRLDLRIATIAVVMKGVTGLILICVGSIITLIILGVDVFALLAGVGLVGVAVSLASQSLIKDSMNGFLIILEDQFGVGDFIKISDMSGIVENMTLRITQIRNAEGQLITIPNSEIKVVANLSSEWARVDLNIPVDYNTDLERALQLIELTALDMSHDPKWCDQILEAPQVMGIDDFGDRGLMVKLWVKTQPLRQWAVARAYRHRLKIAFDQAGLVIPVPQQTLWLNNTPQPLASPTTSSSYPTPKSTKPHVTPTSPQ
jgi:small conductance mechanosensitive channel